MTTRARYGPHNPANNPTSVPVLRVVLRVRHDTLEPYPAALAKQREHLNNRAHQEDRQ